MMMMDFLNDVTQTADNSKKAIPGSVALVTLADEQAAEFVAANITCSAGMTPEFKLRLQAGMNNNDTLDMLLEELQPIGKIASSAQWAEVAEATTDEDRVKLLKSQQSKRCRQLKIFKERQSLPTLKQVVSAAYAEMILREMMGKAKVSRSESVRLGGNVLTDAMREQFTNDQEALKKAIRNVQSKKTGLKKQGLEGSEQWDELVAFENDLKSIRVGGSRVSTVVEYRVDEETAAKAAAYDELVAMMQAKNTDKMKAADNKALLAAIHEVLGTKVVNEETAPAASQE